MDPPTTIPAHVSSAAASGPRPSSGLAGSELREALDAIDDISKLLQTGLTRQELKGAVNILQSGFSHNALARVVLDLRSEADAAKAAQREQ